MSIPDIEFRNKCSGYYPRECSIFQNEISCFRYNPFLVTVKNDLKMVIN